MEPPDQKRTLQSLGHWNGQTNKKTKYKKAYGINNKLCDEQITKNITTKTITSTTKNKDEKGSNCNNKAKIPEK